MRTRRLSLYQYDTKKMVTKRALNQAFAIEMPFSTRSNGSAISGHRGKFNVTTRISGTTLGPIPKQRQSFKEIEVYEPLNDENLRMLKSLKKDNKATVVVLRGR